MVPRRLFVDIASQMLRNFVHFLAKTWYWNYVFSKYYFSFLKFVHKRIDAVASMIPKITLVLWRCFANILVFFWRSFVVLMRILMGDLISLKVINWTQKCCNFMFSKKICIISSNYTQVKRRCSFDKSKNHIRFEAKMCWHFDAILKAVWDAGAYINGSNDITWGG